MLIISITVNVYNSVLYNTTRGAAFLPFQRTSRDIIWWDVWYHNEEIVQKSCIFMKRGEGPIVMKTLQLLLGISIKLLFYEW